MSRSGNNAVVVGAGPVGIACALALRKHVSAVGLLDRRALPSESIDAALDHRVYALSPASRALLMSLGVWQRIDATRVMPIDRMQVCSDADDRDSRVLPRIDFEEGQSLAWMVEHKALMAALVRALHATDVTFAVVPAISGLSEPDGGGKRSLQFADGSSRSADLIVGADGRQSQIRALAGVDVDSKDYLSSAVVANFACTRPHGGTAFQWFSTHGVLAYLPLPGKHMSIVWSVPKARAAELQSLAQASLGAFAAEVSRASGNVLGELECISPVEVVPLNRVLARELVKPGLALVGDAAHGIHPLAGQGANLGYGDVIALSQELAERSVLAGIGDIAVLRRFARARAEPTAAMGRNNRSSAWSVHARRYRVKVAAGAMVLQSSVVRRY